MAEPLRGRADARLEQALAASRLQDPRALYRDRLKTLKAEDPSAFERALQYFGEVLVPRLADQESDPLAEWLGYGQFLAELGGPGSLVDVDETGRARSPGLRPDERPEHTARDRARQARSDSGAAADGSTPSEGTPLVLHLPDDARAPVFVLALPRELTPAQQATFDLLVSGKTRV